MPWQAIRIQKEIQKQNRELLSNQLQALNFILYSSFSLYDCVMTFDTCFLCLDTELPWNRFIHRKAKRIDNLIGTLAISF